ILDLGDGVGVGQQPPYVGVRGAGGGDLRAVDHVGGGFADAPERALDLDLHTAHVDAEAGRLAVHVVAVAGGEGEEEELAAVRAGAEAARLRRDREGVLVVLSADDGPVPPLLVVNLGANGHGRLGWWEWGRSVRRRGGMKGSGRTRRPARPGEAGCGLASRPGDSLSSLDYGLHPHAAHDPRSPRRPP